MRFQSEVPVWRCMAFHKGGRGPPGINLAPLHLVWGQGRSVCVYVCVGGVGVVTPKIWNDLHITYTCVNYTHSHRVNLHYAWWNKPPPWKITSFKMPMQSHTPTLTYTHTNTLCVLHFSPCAFPFLLDLIPLDVLSVIHHGLILAGGDPENHRIRRDRKDALKRITIISVSILQIPQWFDNISHGNEKVTKCIFMIFTHLFVSIIFNAHI